MDATIIVGGKQVSVPSDVLDVFMSVWNYVIDSGDATRIFSDAYTEEQLAAAQEYSILLRDLIAPPPAAGTGATSAR